MIFYLPNGVGVGEVDSGVVDVIVAGLAETGTSEIKRVNIW